MNKMNSKKNKNKHRSNKPANPTPPQKNDGEEAEIVITEEKAEPVPLLQECIPSAVSELADPSYTKNEDAFEEVPKKPKRNKGKNKKGQKDDEIEKHEEHREAEEVKENIQTEDADANKDDVIEKSVKDISVTPAARKKKNKSKKSIEQPPELLKVVDVKVVDTLPMEQHTDTQPLPTEAQEQENIDNEQQSKTAKKKNKKKKSRNDSERSDVSFTMTSQKVMDEKNYPESMENVSKDIETIEPSQTTDTMTDNQLKQKDLSDAADLFLTESQDIVDDQSKEPKGNKKKHKKEKKNPPKELDQLKNDDEQSCKSILHAPVDITEQKQILCVEDIQLGQNQESINIMPTEIPDVGKELSPKPKAKIARPVDKNRKGKVKGDDDNITLKGNNIPEASNLKTEKNEEAVLCSTATIPKIPDLDILQKDTFILEETFPKVNVTSIELAEPVTEGATMDVKIRKKRKKSPYLQKVDTPEAITNIEEPIIVSSEKVIEKAEDKCKIISSVGEEASTIKSEESGGPISEVTPDFIHHPRSTSQQRLDDNNNTVIQDVTLAHDVKLVIPIALPYTPLVQGSGETPEILPEIVTGTTVTELNSKSSSKDSPPEKTDLKSKMMEVNQDMEELRLSIERSLAEFTALEKNEEQGAIAEPNVLNVKEKQTIALESPDIEEPNSPISLSEIAVQEINSSVFLEEKKDNISVPQESPEIDVATDVKVDRNIPHTELKPTTEDIPIEVLKNVITETNEKKSLPTEQTVDVKTNVEEAEAPPICPARKDHKGKNKSKRKGKQETASSGSGSTTSTDTKTTENKDSEQATKDEKDDQKTDTTKEKSKQQSHVANDSESSNIQPDEEASDVLEPDFEPIDNFEDALTSSVDDVNKTFEMILEEVKPEPRQNPEIKIIEPIDDTEKDKKQEKSNPVSQPKNLLGHPDIPVPSNRIDYKKEKNKTPNMRQAKVKIKDSVDIETDKSKESRESQTDCKRSRIPTDKTVVQSISTVYGNDEYIYKYSFRKVFLPNVCHVCRKELKQRVSCGFCSLVFYCSPKHKDEDWPQHQTLCFAVSTIVHLREQKHIYGDAQNIAGHNYRLLRMQMIVSCEKVLKRRLVPWEQEALLYPRICADTSCREWKQSKLQDCDGCGQVFYCIDHPEHLPKTHQRWCKSYSLYQKLVCHQQTQGRLEPKLPTRVMAKKYQIPEKMNEVLASLYDEKIDMTDIQYAALTQLATGPLTAAYSYQVYEKLTLPQGNGVTKLTLTIHVVGAELQYEADTLNKWEVFFLHLRPDLKELRVVLTGIELNPSNLPLDLLGKVKLCGNCTDKKRRLMFNFQDKTTYSDYYSSDDYVTPDLVCAFNPNIQRASIHTGKDPWPSVINSIFKTKAPFLVTSHIMSELNRDLAKIKKIAPDDFKILSEPKFNAFASVRPDRNFISDDEMPLLFKNYCYMVACSA